MTDVQRKPVEYRPGAAVVRASQGLARTRVDLTPVTTSEVWEGPVQELRARLRDEARDRRVKPWGDAVERPGLPRGWVAMRVYLTDAELEKARKPRPVIGRAGWIALGIVSILSGIAALGYWAYLQMAALVAGFTVGTGTAVGIVAVLLLVAAGGTTVVTVVTQVTVKRGWW
jgi:hypothetical protein